MGLVTKVESGARKRVCSGGEEATGFRCGMVNGVDAGGGFPATQGTQPGVVAGLEWNNIKFKVFASCGIIEMFAEHARLHSLGKVCNGGRRSAGTARSHQLPRLDAVGTAEAFISAEKPELQGGGTFPNPLVAHQQLVNRTLPARETVAERLAADTSLGEGSLFFVWCTKIKCGNSHSTGPSPDSLEGRCSGRHAWLIDEECMCKPCFENWLTLSNKSRSKKRQWPGAALALKRRTLSARSRAQMLNELLDGGETVRAPEPSKKLVDDTLNAIALPMGARGVHLFLGSSELADKAAAWEEAHHPAFRAVRQVCFLCQKLKEKGLVHMVPTSLVKSRHRP